MAFFRALCWGGLLAIFLGGLGGWLLAMPATARLGTILLFYLLPAALGLATALFLHGINAILVSLVLSALAIGLAVQWVSGVPGAGFHAVAGFGLWILAGIVVGALAGMAIRHNLLGKSSSPS